MTSTAYAYPTCGNTPQTHTLALDLSKEPVHIERGLAKDTPLL